LKHLQSLTDLKDFGINPLTGEACAYSMRLLCDLSADGEELVAGFLGLRDTTSFPANWNSMVGEKDSVGSVMLTRSTLKELMYFALFNVEKCDVVIGTLDGSVIGLSVKDTYYQGYLDLAAASPEKYTVQRNNATASAQGGRNEHQFTGRTL